MTFFRSIRWALLAIVLDLAMGGAWLTFQPLYAKGHHGRDHRQAETALAAPASLSEAEVNQAKALFAGTCAGCHAERLEGGVGPSLVGVGSRHSRDKIERIVQYGKGRKKAVPMPAGLASAKDARLIARWLATNPMPKGASASPAEPHEGGR